MFYILYNNLGGAGSQPRPVHKDDVLVNEEIRARELLLIGADGSQLGIKSSREALQIAAQEGLDLVMVAPNAKPPVCKLMDYNKYRYEQQRKAREARKNQKVVEIKEIRLTAVIDKHDFETKIRSGYKFLEKGDKLKVAVRLPYRAGQILIQQGKDVLNTFRERCEAVGDVEKDILQEGRYINMVLAPKKK